MSFNDVFDTFAMNAPIPVLTRATLENCFGAAELDRIFIENAQEQYEGDLLFSTVVDVMKLAVLKGRSSVNAAYNDKKEEIAVSVNSVYQKLAGIESGVSRAMVRETGERMLAVVEALGGTRELVKGFRTKIADGKHLNRTERRLKPLRSINGAPLPGQMITVLDADARLVIDAVPSEDGHASERTMFAELAETIEKNDLWIADRHFCTLDFLHAIDDADACFAIRLHGNLKPTSIGRRKRIGRCETGVVYEQRVSVGRGDRRMEIRQIEVDLDKPTRDGSTKLVILSNLPKRVSALRIAELYRDRWTIEQVFQHIAQSLNAEIKTLAYPKAAILGFCIALVAANIMSVVKAAIAAANDRDHDTLSTYYLSDEIRANYGGMMVILRPSFWRERFKDLTAKQLSRQLLRIARNVPDDRFEKTTTRRKTPPRDVGPKTNRPHVSTRRVLDEHYAAFC